MYVEVILSLPDKRTGWYCILHVCGGDPTLLTITMATILYSPRMWSDPVGALMEDAYLEYSPRMWR